MVGGAERLGCLWLSRSGRSIGTFAHNLINNPMRSSLHDFLPKTRFELAGGGAFVLGTMWDDETCREMVLFQFVPAGAAVPSVEFAISADSAETVIRVLQDAANRARFISGQPMYEYPEPVPDHPPRRSIPAKKKKRAKKSARKPKTGE